MVKPYYQDEVVTIYHGDCREVLPSLPRVDLVLTDPPYGLDIAANPFRQKFEPQEWDRIPCDTTTLSAVVGSAAQAIIWGGNYFPLPPSQCFLVWDKVQPEDFSSSMCEMAWTNLEGPAKLFRRRVVGYSKAHPTQKPVELMAWCLGLTKAGVIIDPLMGSGTTLVAAKELNHKAIGIEIEERYCEIAAKRCESIQVGLFDTPAILLSEPQSDLFYE